jgi:hypothetical protein
MTGIRRIREHDAAAVTDLLDRMCRETPDGGPLTPRGRRAIQRMLEAAEWHRDTFCLVAVDGDELTGFVVGTLDAGDGLLPCPAGKVEETYAAAVGLRRRLTEAAVARLREMGAGTIRCTLDRDDTARRTLLKDLGFAFDMITMSRYDTDGGPPDGTVGGTLSS